MNEKDRLMDELKQLRKKIVELEKNDRLFKETEKSGKIGGWQFDPSTLKQTWSEEIFRILEIDLAHGAPEVPKGMEFIDPGFRHEAEKAVQKAIEYGEPYDQEWMVTTYKGNKKWVNAVGNPKMENGKVVTVSGSFQDITSEKIAKEELKKSEEKFRTIINSSPFPIAVVDEKDQNIMFWSKSALELFGHDPKTAEEWYQLAYPDPEYRNNVIERWKPFLETAQNSTKAVNTGEYEIRCKNGSVKICELYAQFIPGSLFVTLNDITERKKADDNLKALNQQLLEAKEKAEKSEEKFSTIFNMSSSMICVADINTATFKFLNPAFKKVLGYEEKELLSKPFLDFIHPDDVRSTIDVIEKKLKEGIPQIYFENRYKRKDGSYCYLAWNSFPFPEKGITYAIAHDITEQKKTELELIKYKDHLEELVKDRTAELEKKNESLKILNSVFVGRELRMKELKDKIDALEGKE